MTSRTLPGAGLLGADRLVRTPDGRMLRTMVRGHGDDLVVLEAGLGMSGLYWGEVHERIAPAASVVAYERSGYGGSDPDPSERGLSRLADDLGAVIDAHPHRRLVLVGHSWGGPIVRIVAARRLAAGLGLHGMVLVDPTDETAAVYFGVAARIAFRLQAATSVPLARAGLLSRMSRGIVAGLPEQTASAVLDASCTVTAARAAAAELRMLLPGLRQLRDAGTPLGDLPIRVLSGRLGGRLERRIRAALNDAHARTAAAHPAGVLVPARHSGHGIPVTEPELVAAQALDLLGG